MSGGSESPVGRLGHVPALNGLRGVAIASVVSFHYFHQPEGGGFVGVDLFFVLSGFLITTLLLEEHTEKGSVSLRSFYERRVRRLLPAAWTTLMFAVVMGYALGAATAFFYVADIYDAISPPTGGPTGVYWSLSLEEQFYLVWPILLIFLLRRGLPLVKVLVVLGAAFMLWRLGWLLAGASVTRIYYSPDTHGDPLIVGCLLAALRHAGYWTRSKLPLVIGLTLLALVLVSFKSETFGSESLGMLMAELAAVGLIVAAVNGSQLLAVKPLIWLGVISYSLYLWHGFAAHFFPPKIALPLALLLAWLSYRFIETRFRRHRSTESEPVSSNPAPAPAIP